MTEQELRSLVREAIARHMSSAGTVAPSHRRTVAPSDHFSHGLFVLAESEGPCVIEPSVACNHCGYCKSYGH